MLQSQGMKYIRHYKLYTLGTPKRALEMSNGNVAAESRSHLVAPVIAF